jgi:hypothetical protein
MENNETDKIVTLLEATLEEAKKGEYRRIIILVEAESGVGCGSVNVGMYQLGGMMTEGLQQISERIQEQRNQNKQESEEVA